MKKTLRTIIAKLPWHSVSFSARSGMIATSLLASGRAFSGGGPSGQVPTMEVQLSTLQLMAVKNLIIEKIDSQKIEDEERLQLESLLQKIDVSEAKPSENAQQ